MNYLEIHIYFELYVGRISTNKLTDNEITLWPETQLKENILCCIMGILFKGDDSQLCYQWYLQRVNRSDSIRIYQFSLPGLLLLAPNVIALIIQCCCHFLHWLTSLTTQLDIQILIKIQMCNMCQWTHLINLSFFWLLVLTCPLWNFNFYHTEG